MYYTDDWLALQAECTAINYFGFIATVIDFYFTVIFGKLLIFSF